MKEHENYRISASKVSEVILALRPSADLLKYAEEGRDAHDNAIPAIIDLANGLYPWGIDFELPFKISSDNTEKGKLQIVQLRNGLSLTAIPDYIVPGIACIEVKPRFESHHAIQTVLTCMTMSLATNSQIMQGLMYTYRDKKLYMIQDGGEPVWEKLTDLCWFACNIYDTQERIKQIKKVGIQGALTQWDILHGTYSEDHPDFLKLRLSNHLINTRREIFEPLLDEIWDELKNLITP